MTLTEANTIQEYILKILQKLDWEYLPPESLQRKGTDILLEETLKQKLQKIMFQCFLMEGILIFL